MVLQLQEVLGLHRHLRNTIPPEWKNTQHTIMHWRFVKKRPGRYLSGSHQCYTVVVSVYDRPCVYMCCWWMRAVSLSLSSFSLTERPLTDISTAVCRGSVQPRHARQKCCCFLGGSARVVDNLVRCLDFIAQHSSSCPLILEYIRTHVRPIL